MFSFVCLSQNRKHQQEQAKQRSDSALKVVELRKENERQRNQVNELIREKENLQKSQQTQTGARGKWAGDAPATHATVTNTRIVPPQEQ
mgnify:CR=1 FL=1